MVVLAMAWTVREATHLLNRTTFTATADEVNAALLLGREETVRRLIAGESLTGAEQSLLSFDEVKADGKGLKAEQMKDYEVYWLYRMLNTQAPLHEKVALFWHGHFATSKRKVNNVSFMANQIDMFRDDGMGNFKELVLKVGKDPAMMEWLDANSNRKGKANENYAREVMELFTLGIGNYTEDDIKNAAKAFTGWTVNNNTGEVKFNKKNHDESVKKVLGEQGNFNETTVVDVLFDQEALPLFMATKLLRFFAVDNPSSEWVAKVGDDFSRNNEVSDVLQNLFLSDEFYKPEYQLALIKTPAEYTAGVLRTLNLPLARTFTSYMARMGQELYYPPDVAGWRGGPTWLMSSSVLARYQFAQNVSKRVSTKVLTAAESQPEDKTDAGQWVDLWANKLGLWDISDTTKKAIAQYAEESFVHMKSQTNGLRGMLFLLLICPEAQMK
jgi:uncharacterized protein (DUF1800 family)